MELRLPTAVPFVGLFAVLMTLFAVLFSKASLYGNVPSCAMFPLLTSTRSTGSINRSGRAELPHRVSTNCGCDPHRTYVGRDQSTAVFATAS